MRPVIMPDFESGSLYHDYARRSGDHHYRWHGRGHWYCQAADPALYPEQSGVSGSKTAVDIDQCATFRSLLAFQTRRHGGRECMT